MIGYISIKIPTWYFIIFIVGNFVFINQCHCGEKRVRKIRNRYFGVNSFPYIPVIDSVRKKLALKNGKTKWIVKGTGIFFIEIGKLNAHLITSITLFHPVSVFDIEIVQPFVYLTDSAFAHTDSGHIGTFYNIDFFIWKIFNQSGCAHPTSTTTTNYHYFIHDTHMSPKVIYVIITRRC